MHSYSAVGAVAISDRHSPNKQANNANNDSNKNVNDNGCSFYLNGNWEIGNRKELQDEEHPSPGIGDCHGKKKLSYTITITVIAYKS